MGFARYIAVALTLLCLSATTASAYEDDTHYLMTYVICRSAGFTHDEALVVAAADVAMDYRDSTVAAGSLASPSTDLGLQAHVDAGWMWHAVTPSDAGWNALQSTSHVLQQKDLMFQLALDKWLDPSLDREQLESWRLTPAAVKERLFWLGVFFHYQQDTWAHRRSNVGDWDSRKSWQPYQTPFGHVGHSERGVAGIIHDPDRPPWHPLAALRNLEEGIMYAGFFLRTVLNRQPNAFLANFEIGPGTNRDDLTWPKRSPIFNQLTLVAKTDAGKYLEALIRAQIDVYKLSGGTPARPPTADEAKLNDVLFAFAKVLAVHGPKLGMGTEQDLTRDLALVPLAKKDLLSLLGGNESVGTNEMVAKMDAWQYVLGFPTTAKPYGDLYPQHPNPNRDLQNLLGAWKLIPKAEAPILDVSAVYKGDAPATDGGSEILGVANGMLWHKSALLAGWQQVAGSRPDGEGLTSAKMQPDGMILGVLSNNQLAIKASLKPEDKWQLIADSAGGQVINLTVKRDGTIIGVDQNGQLRMARLKDDKRHLDNGWQLLPIEKVPVVAVAVMPNQESFLGVSVRGVLLYKNTLETPWKRAPNSNAATELGSPSPWGGTVALRSVAMLPNGGLLGIRKDTSQLLLKSSQSPAWPPLPNPDALSDSDPRSGYLGNVSFLPANNVILP